MSLTKPTVSSPRADEIPPMARRTKAEDKRKLCLTRVAVRGFVSKRRVMLLVVNDVWSPAAIRPPGAGDSVDVADIFVNLRVKWAHKGKSNCWSASSSSPTLYFY